MFAQWLPPPKRNQNPCFFSENCQMTAMSINLLFTDNKDIFIAAKKLLCIISINSGKFAKFDFLFIIIIGKGEKMKKAGYLLLFLSILYVTSCGDTSEVAPGRRGSRKNNITPIRTLEADGNVYITGWQLEVNDGLKGRLRNKNSTKEDSLGIETGPANLEGDNKQVTNNRTDSNAVQRKIKGYQATIDKKTGKIKTYPVYEDDKN
jgi:hypothetical protein